VSIVDRDASPSIRPALNNANKTTVFGLPTQKSLDGESINVPAGLIPN
jgi:hypothetical protein